MKKFWTVKYKVFMKEEFTIVYNIQENQENKEEK